MTENSSTVDEDHIHLTLFPGSTFPDFSGFSSISGRVLGTQQARLRRFQKTLLNRFCACRWDWRRGAARSARATGLRNSRPPSSGCPLRSSPRAANCSRQKNCTHGLLAATHPHGASFAEFFPENCTACAAQKIRLAGMVARNQSGNQGMCTACAGSVHHAVCVVVSIILWGGFASVARWMGLVNNAPRQVHPGLRDRGTN